MARKLEFDYTRTLEKGMRLFWAKGYDATSSRELLKVMDLGEGSFYNTFKSKKHAYLESLKHYNATVNGKRGVALMSAPTAKLGIRALFGDVLECLDDPKSPSKLCLMAASISRDVLDEPELKKYVETQFLGFVAAVTERLVADKEAGLLGANFKPEVIAPIIVTYLQGVFRFSMISYNRAELEQQMEVFLVGLGV